MIELPPFPGEDGEHHHIAGDSDSYSRNIFAYNSLYADMRTELYSKFADPYMDFYKSAISALELEPGDRVLEIGCGRGLFVDAIARSQHQGQIIGLDPSLYTTYATEEDLRRDGYDNVIFLLGDARHLPLEDDSIEKAAANYMLYHVHDLEAVLREIKRVLVPGGTFEALTRGDYNLVRYYDFARQTTEELGFSPYQSPYLGFDAEDAVSLLGQYFEIDFARCIPNDLTQATGVSSVLRPMHITAEGWPFYFQSLAGMVSAHSEHELQQQGGIMPKDFHSKIRIKLNDLVSPIFFREIEKSPDHVFTDTAQDKLVTCINTKKD